MFFPQRKLGRNLLLMVLCALPPFVSALDIEKQVRVQVESELQQYLQLLDRPLRQYELKLSLPKGLQETTCDELELSRRNATEPPLGRLSYQLNCSSPESWQSRATVESHLWLDVVVASRAFVRGESLALDQLALKRVDVGNLHGDFSVSKEALVGYEVKRKIALGKVIQRNYLQEYYAVKKGDEVTLVVAGALFSASTKGIVLKEGRIGDKVTVRNKSSGKLLYGVVRSSQQIEIFSK